MILTLLALALAPIIFFFTLVWVRDKEREPLGRLVLTFVFGVISVAPILFTEVFLSEVTGTDSSPDPSTAAIYAFFVIATSEEFFKYLAVRLYAYPSKHFNEPYDGIMYCVAASLGMAALENVLYVAQYGVGNGFLRMFTAVPGHAMMGVVMGYFVGLAKFKKDSGTSFVYHILGLLAAIAIHGFYDFFLMWKVEGVALLAFLVLIVGAVLAWRAMRLHRETVIALKADGGSDPRPGEGA